MKFLKYPLSFLVFSLSACNVTPDFVKPTVEIPATWRDANQSATQTTVDPKWWQTFGSPKLNQLILQAIAYNNDLAAAGQRVEQAKAQAKIAGANLFPQLGIQGNTAHNVDETGEIGKQNMNFTIAYEVDLWGKNRAAKNAGENRLLSEVFARDALQLVVMSNVSQAYFNLLALNERKHIATDFLKNVTDVLTIIEARFNAGAVSELDVVQQKTELANARASLDLLNQHYALAENALAILLGKPPQATKNTEPFLTVQMPKFDLLQPANLLERRPDIRQIEMELLAANADIGIARAAFYPKLQLNLDTILASPQPAGIAASLAAGLVQPIFQGGRLDGNLEYANARQAELVETYRKTVLTAFKEVEDAAAIRTNSDRRLKMLSEAVNNAEQSYQLSLQRYRLGLIDYQVLLNTQRSLLNAENSKVQARLDVLIALVQIYQALGGGFYFKSF
ncbi:MAG: efflux transporter outer membrane subunit [Methylococcaceae bacterium]